MTRGFLRRMMIYCNQQLRGGGEGADEDVFLGWWEAWWDIVGEILWMDDNGQRWRCVSQNSHGHFVLHRVRHFGGRGQCQTAPVLDGGGLVWRQRTMSDWASPTLILTPTNCDTLTLHGHHAVQSKDRTEGMCCRNGQLQDRGRILKRRGLACLTELPHLLLRGTIHSPNHCTAHILQSKNPHCTLLLGCHHKQKH